MASSLIINGHHIDFESVFGLDDAEFFANSSVREDGMVVRTIGGTAIEISQEMFAAAFDLPTEGLIDLTDVPKNFVFYARSLFSDSTEQAGSFDSMTRDRFLLMTAITFDAFDEAFDEEFEIANKERQVSEEVIDVTIEEGTSERSMSRKSVAEELMTIDDLLLQISDDLMLPITAVELTKIRLGESLNFGGVQERDLYSASLPRISSHDKGKGILVEDEPVRGNPAREMVELICRDVDFLVQLRDQVMVDVVNFFHSFSINKLTSFDALLALREKEKFMLEWAETDSLETAVKRKMYILANSSSTDVSMHFDSADIPMHDQAATQASAPVDFSMYTDALEDLRSSLDQRILDSNCEILSKVNAVELGVHGDLLKLQVLLRQSLENACRVLERQGTTQATQINDLKKGLMTPFGTIVQDLFDIKKKQREQDAKLIALDGRIAAIRSEQLVSEPRSRVRFPLIARSAIIGKGIVGVQ
ncbi:hypothetical protein F511_24539 [Dorcoceras hygrometricum]|uniref:Uncharacterized protein n=1 Tax=Dorcoceras hygrometricum TaxID=472368 RepID=A0A2Z7BVT7_9LAMI|nr:hypothetical protein F511_24539 [Dorcoceras hygrometricum]